MSKSQRIKGQRGERKTLKRFKPVYPEIERNLNDALGGKGFDFVNTGNLYIQNKHYKNHVPISKINEIVCPPGGIPVLVSWPTNRHDEPMVIISLENFTRILADIGEAY